MDACEINSLHINYVLLNSSRADMSKQECCEQGKVCVNAGFMHFRYGRWVFKIAKGPSNRRGQLTEDMSLFVIASMR